MARTDSLRHYLSDVADAIRTAGGTSEKIKVSEFDEAILNLTGGGGNGGNEPVIDIQTVHTPEQIRFSYYPVTTFNPAGLNTAKVSNMSYMFYNSQNLMTANLISFNTANVTNMAAMFANCSNLQSVDVSNFDTSKVTSLSGMFQGTSLLTTVNLNNFKTNNVITFNSMFAKSGISGINGKLNLTDRIKGDLATNVSGMFANCPNLIELELANFNAPKMINSVGKIVENCPNLVSLNLANFNGVNINYFSEWAEHSAFENCNNLKYINLSNFNGTRLDMWPGRHFANLPSLESIDVSGLCKDGVAGEIDIVDLFENCQNLKSVNISNLLINCPPTSLAGIFRNCTNINTDYIIFDFDNISSLAGAFENCFQMTSFNFQKQILNIQALQNIDYMFANCTNLHTVDISNFSKYNMSMYSIFYGCYNLQTVNASYFNGENINLANFPLLNIFGSNNYFMQNLDLSYWRANQVANNLNFGGHANAAYVNLTHAQTAPGAISNINLYFSSNSQVKSINFSNTDLSGVSSWKTDYAPANLIINFTNTNFKPKNLQRVFNNSKFTTFNINAIPGLNFEDVETLFGAFSYSSLISANLSGIYSNKLTNLAACFEHCSRLTSVDFNNFTFGNTQNISIARMFNYCSNLTLLNLSTFNQKNAINNLSEVCRACSNLTTVDFGDFDASNIRNFNGMFDGCRNLTTLQGQITNIGKIYNQLNKTESNRSNTKIGFGYSPLTHDSILMIFNGLYNIAEYNLDCDVVLNSQILSTLTKEEKNIATSKGWSLVGMV